MRIWLAEDLNCADSGCLEAAVQQVTGQSGERHILVGTRPLGPSLADDLRDQQAEALIVSGSAPLLESTLAALPETEIGVLVATTAEHCERYGALAQAHPVWFLPTRPTAEMLRLALQGLAACCERQTRWKTQLNSLQQRLEDRIVIERAKGILVQRLGISEEDAYRRLRVSSRRQRRQIRDIAQSLIDTQALLLPEQNGYANQSVMENFQVDENEV
jgi:hypothetical protein